MPLGSKGTRLTPITREAFDKLSVKQQWDIFASMRGPDLANSTAIKFYTTSVLRWMMSKAIRVGGLVNSDLPFVILPSTCEMEWIETTKKARPFDLSHFYEHVFESADHLNVPIYTVSSSLWWDTLSKAGHYNYYGPLGVFAKEHPELKEWYEKHVAVPKPVPFGGDGGTYVVDSI